MTPNPFHTTGIIILLLWGLAIIGYIPAISRYTRFMLSVIPLLIGWSLLTLNLIDQWQTLGHPPMRTVNQTMMWASFFLPLIMLGIQLFRKTRIHAIPSIVVAAGLLMRPLLKVEVADRMLMPALQSPWFAPHVLIYMLSYGAIAAAALLALTYLIFSLFRKLQADSDIIDVTRILMRIAYPLLTIGMLMGAYWAKLCWGHYWGWDSKETAAFISWTSLLIYTHLDYRTKLSPRWNLGLALLAGMMILFTWVLINYLPSAQGSEHVYAMQ